MWRQAVFPTVLFGLMVVASCHELSENGENGLLEKLGAFGSIRNPRSSGDARWNQFEEMGNAEMKKRCDKNAGPQAYANVQNANDEMKRCIKSVADIDIDYERLGRELVMPGGTYIANSVKKGCRVYGKVNECASTAMEAYKACYNAEEQVAVQEMQNVTTSVIHYICKDSGAELLSFIDNQGFQCVMLNIQGLLECLKKVAPEITNAQPGKQQADPEAIFKFLKFEGDECSKINTLQTCVRENLEKCNQQQPARFIDGFFDAAKSPTPCSGAPRASSIPSASIILSALAFAYLSLSQNWF